MITIPTLSQLYTDIKSDLESKFTYVIPVFGKNFIRALAAVQAAKLKVYYLAIANIQKNIFIDTADPESVGGTLERFGRIKLGRNPFPATAGQYSVQVSGTIGATIPARTTFITDDDSSNPGKLFILDSAFVLVTGSDTILLRALEAGTGSRIFTGETLTATTPIADVSQGVLFIGETVSPVDAEDIEDYRDKGIQSYRLEAQGGAVGDYRIWSSDAQGVLRVYPYAKTGFPNEINVFVEATVADSTDGKGTPSGTILTDVDNVIELDPDTTKDINERGRRPLGMFVNVLAVNPLDVIVNIAGFIGITAAKQTAITNAITNALNNTRPYIGGADVLETKNDIFDNNKAINAILTAVPGSIFGAVTINVDSNPVSTYQFINGDIPYFDSVTYS